MDFTDDLPVFYSDFADALSCEGVEFNGLIASLDKTVFDIDVVTTHTLRYPDTVCLSKGSVVSRSSDNGRFAVIKVPERINASEFVAELVRK